ncbi:inositol 1,3,4-trisphosphate 5/6-kinase 4 [Amborella trichopoda]|uniref:Uncharacterized protein n=1 Tax=Amborella trichopoda TaxID=13333 RepID=U5DDA0_AMBTC|nr:inositol 1,3,4-trisphosphate 5/6-kinase 4 [Amborella trichopoda]ERN20195.1 hypothetical protein AMTR_s00066p00117670 [Amborella trichopoda]|eukprot:XP_006858728.1 inositol 1,3,4-trisphosphate 5/6-kinase 4 [Amborella trichopoda]
MEPIRRVVIEESLLLSNDNGEVPVFQQGAETLLQRLRLSKLHTAIGFDSDTSSQKVSFLNNMVEQYSFDCMVLNISCIEDSLSKALRYWNATGESCLYVTSRKDEDFILKISSQKCRIVVMSVETDSVEKLGLTVISKLEELPLTICRLSKMVLSDSILTVGYIMKPSREKDFAKRGAFPMVPIESGLMFVPITFDLPLSCQIQELDVVLHKATDEIVSVDLGNLLDFPGGICFSKGMQELQRYIHDHPYCCVIDPFKNIYPLLDRHRIQQILIGLEDLNSGSSHRIRAPHFLKVDDFNASDLAEKLSQSQLSLPAIVKPQIACGVSDAHSMAILFNIENFSGLQVPLPAIIQEYIDHGSVLFKFYMLGEQIFHAVKKSTPNAHHLLVSSDKDGSLPVVFDSLKSLPTGDQTCETGQCSLDIELVNNAAIWLRRRLDLTIFGFDVVIQEGSGDHVIVDVNYLPSFKEVTDSVAMPAFWEAIKTSYQSRKAK